jgi:hypothetical protein
MVKRTLADPKATWAGGIPQASFAMFKTWMKTSNAGGTRSFGCWDVEAIVVARGGCEEGAWDTCSEKDAEHKLSGISFTLYYRRLSSDETFHKMEIAVFSVTEAA